MRSYVEEVKCMCVRNSYTYIPYKIYIHWCIYTHIYVGILNIRNEPARLPSTNIAKPYHHWLRRQHIFLFHHNAFPALRVRQHEKLTAPTAWRKISFGRKSQHSNNKPHLGHPYLTWIYFYICYFVMALFLAFVVVFYELGRSLA